VFGPKPSETWPCLGKDWFVRENSLANGGSFPLVPPPLTFLNLGHPLWGAFLFCFCGRSLCRQGLGLFFYAPCSKKPEPGLGHPFQNRVAGFLLFSNPGAKPIYAAASLAGCFWCSPSWIFFFAEPSQGKDPRAGLLLLKKGTKSWKEESQSFSTPAPPQLCREKNTQRFNLRNVPSAFLPF